ncbi:hypothetical protein UFOVP175_38 [uncultured Caudovirales phage]|uniref:Uncharacterized protein n=1 Tax=uncultured Caudovirales phage TaxID=2100421 RepID=A0A6J7WFY5_9CAUD|nr:hypothetical protein UFOVP175_38 [uncultured Caudovirales phage]
MTVDAPAPRNYAQETADTLRTQLELAPQRYAAEAQFAPKYQALQLDLVRQATPELLALYRDQIAPTMGQVEAASRAASRAGDIADIAKLGPQARAAIQGFAPEQTQIADILARNATSGLLAGSQLTPEQQRAAQQQARMASSARGIAQSPNAAFQEALRSQMVGAGLQQQRQQQAMGALQAGQGVYGDVFQQVLGRPSQAFAGSQGFLGQAQGFNPGMLFQPESAYAANIYGGNQQAQMAANAAGASATSGLIGGGLGALGSIGGGAFQGAGSIGGFGKLFGGR